MGLLYFAIRIVNSVLNPTGKHQSFGGNSKYRRAVINSDHQNFFQASLNASRPKVQATYSLPEWQAVKLTFFAPC